MNGGDVLDSALRLVSAAIFTATAVAAAYRWGSRRGEGNGWAAAAFASLAASSIYAAFFPDSGGPEILGRVTMALVLAFPYFILRFAASLRARRGMVLRIAAAATGALVVAGVLLPSTTMREIGWVGGLFIVTLLLQWGLCCGLAATQLAKQAASLPTPAKRRLRLLSAALVLLCAVLILSVVTPAGESDLALPVRMLVIVSGIAFYLGFAPPQWLRTLWQQGEREALQSTIQDLISAPTVDSLTSAFLPQAARLVGAHNLTLLDEGGTLVADYTIPADEYPASSRRYTVDLPTGARLQVTPGRGSPHFGNDELELLRTIGSLAMAAIDKSRLYEREIESREAAERAQHELEEQIEERREAEREALTARQEADVANKTKSEFLSKMSHELRTPLNAVIGFSQLLQSDVEDESQREHLGYILKAGRHLLDLINEILDISRIEANNLSMSVEAVHCSEVATEAAELVFPMAKERSIDLVVDDDCDPELYVMADRQRLKQVLLNLLSNAVKYNREEGRVTLRWEERDDTVRVCVSDTGSGIPPDKMDRLFNAFDRLGAETSSVEGTGLGLSLSKHLVELMEGSIDVNSSSAGSTFTVVLPTAALHPSMHEDPIDLTEIETTPSGGLVLYIEDNLANSNLVERILARRGGIELLSAMQGSMGIQLARDHRPDLILLDLHLPDRPGTEILAALKDDPETASIPVVVVSADATPGQQQRMIEAGAADYMTKPFDLKHFEELLARYTRRQVTAQAG